MKKIDSQALDVLQKALGLSGPGSPVTELTDGVVDQVLDVTPIVRRSRTQGQTSGLYTGLLRNAHAAAESKSSLLQPYVAVPGTSLAPYPSVMPAGFDVWVLSAAVTQLSGTGTISAALRVTVPGSVMGISSAAGAAISNYTLAFWDKVIVEGSTFGVTSGDVSPWVRLGFRLPRSGTTQLIFASTSSAIATFDCFVMLGVFPVALGQDVLV